MHIKWWGNSLKRIKEQNGTSAIEFAIVAPVFFLLVLTGIDLSTVLWEQYTLNYAVSYAARYVFVNPGSTSAQVETYISTLIPTLPDTPTYTINVVPKSQATISASVTHTFISFPFSSMTVSASVVQPLNTAVS